MGYTYTTDEQLVSDVCDANFRSARFNKHDWIDALYLWCKEHGKLEQYKIGIDLSLTTYGA